MRCQHRSLSASSEPEMLYSTSCRSHGAAIVPGCQTLRPNIGMISLHLEHVLYGWAPKLTNILSSIGLIDKDVFFLAPAALLSSHSGYRRSGQFYWILTKHGMTPPEAVIPTRANALRVLPRRSLLATLGMAFTHKPSRV